MSYGLYKYIEANELSGDVGDLEFRIELWKKGYAGSTEQLEGADVYFENTWEDMDSRNPFEKPLNGSFLSMYFYVQNSSHLALLTEIQNADEDEFLLKKKVDGAYDWQGRVVNDLLQYEEGDYPFIGKITAKDLAYLKGQEYTLSTGYEKIITTIAGILNTLAYGCSIITSTSWVENNSNTSDDFLNQVYHDKYTFRKYSTSSIVDDRPISQYEVLNRICRSHQLILRQANGAWYIYQLSELEDPTNAKTFQYNSSGVQTGSTTQDLTTPIDDSDLYSLPSGSNQINPAVKKATVVFDHRTGTTEQLVNASFLSSSTDPALPNATFQMPFNGSGDEYVIVQGRTYGVSSRDYEFDNVLFPQSSYLLKSSQYYWIDQAQKWQEVADITTTRESVAPGNIDTANNKIRIISKDFRHGDIVRFESGFALSIDANTEYYLIDVSGEVATGSDTLYYQISTEPDGTPVNISTPSASNKYVYRVSNRQQMTNRTIPFGGTTWWYDFSFSTSTIPSDSNEDVHFYAMSSIMPPNTQDAPVNQYWEYIDIVNQWRDITVSVRDVVTSNGDSITYESEQTGDFSTELSFYGVYFGDGPLDYSRSALAITTTTTADTPTSQWDFRDDSVSSPTNSNFFKIWLKEVLNFQRGNRRTLSGDLYGFYDGYQVVEYESKYFFFLGGTHTGKGNTWSGDWVEIDIATGTDTFITYVDSTNSIGSGGGTGGGNPIAVEGNYLEIANNLSDVASASTARDNLELGTSDSPTFAGLTVNGNISVTGNVDGRDVSADGADLDELYTTIGLSALTSAEVDQLENIDSVTISNTQWGYLGALDQSLTTISDVQFDDITSTGIIYTDNIDTVSIVWNTSTQVWDATPSEYFNNPVFIGTSLDVDNDLEVDGYANIGTDLDVGGNTALLGTLSVGGNTTLGGTLTLSGSADFNSTMNLQGNLTTQANLQDDGFSEGWSGTNWKINADGSAEFEEMRIRGALRVYEFIAKQISTIGGSEILSIAQGRVVSAGSGEIEIENVTGTPGNSFKSGDLWICQVVDINNDLESGGSGSIVKSVRGLVDSVAGNTLTVTVESGSLNDLEQGDLIVGYGSTSDADRQAIMYRNVDRSEDNLIMRLQTGITEFSHLQAVGNTRVAFGDLYGYSGLSTETFGFFAGSNSGGHILATSSGLFLKDGTTVLAQLTSNTFKVGGDTKYIEFDGTDLDVQAQDFKLEAGELVIDSSLAKKIVIKNDDEPIIAIGDFSFGAEVEDTSSSSATSTLTNKIEDSTATPINLSSLMDTTAGTYTDGDNIVVDSAFIELQRDYNNTRGKWIRVQFNYQAPAYDVDLGLSAIGFNIFYFGETISQTGRAHDDTNTISGSVDKTLFVPATYNVPYIEVQALAPVGGLTNGNNFNKVEVSSLSITEYDNTYTYTDIGNDGFRVYNSGGRNKLDFSGGKAEGTFETLSIGGWDFVLDGDGNLELQFEGTLVQQFTKP